MDEEFRLLWQLRVQSADIQYYSDYTVRKQDGGGTLFIVSVFLSFMFTRDMFLLQKHCTGI